jgi:hypothetical protein
LATSVLATSIIAIAPVTISQAAAPKTLKLLWADEFNGKKGMLPSSKNWDYDLGNGYGWGNAELEYYTNKPADISTDGKGKLVISANRISASLRKTDFVSDRRAKWRCTKPFAVDR